MWMFGLLFGLFVLVTSLILPWVNHSGISELRENIDRLQRQIDRLKTEGIKPAAPANAAQMTQPYTRKQEDIVPPAPEPVVAAAHILPKPEMPTYRAAPEPQREATHRSAPIHEAAHQSNGGKSKTFEQQFGGKAFVWLGGVALALAGFFMVKYSIETGLLSPAVRVTLGLVFGVAMLGAGYWVRSQPRIANGERIAQALSGAGIADLYACLFAGTSLYGLFPNAIGFSAMAIVTAIAVVLSLQQGMPIAILGLIGGFLTPALVGSTSPSAPLLFLYLYFVLTGLMFVIRRQGWWPLAIPTVFIGFAWVLIWMFSGNFVPGDGLWLGLFLMATSITIVMTSPPEGGSDSDYVFMPFSVFNYLTLGASIVLMGFTAGYSGFGMMEWGLFGLISLGGIGLAAFNQRLYSMVPWLSMAVSAIMLAVWQHSSTPEEFALVLISFAMLHIVPATFLQPRSEKPLLWAGLIGATSLGYYLLGYFELHSTAIVSGIPLFWGMLAFGFSAVAIIALQDIMRDNHLQKQYLLAIYAGLATAFLSIGLTIEMKHEFLSVAFAAEALAVAWINTKVDIKALRVITGALTCVFGILLIPQLLLLVQLAVYSLIEEKLPLQEGIPIVNWPIFQLGVPAVFFMFGSYPLRKQKDDALVQSLEVTAIALIGVMGYYVTRHAFHVDENVLFVKAGFTERGVITNILFVYGLACLWAGRTFARQAVSGGGIALIGVALFRIGYFDLLAHNPLWSEQKVGDLPVANALLLTYGLPIIWTWQTGRELAQTGRTAWNRYGYGIMLLLAFCLLSFEVRQFYHGTLLNGDIVGNAEIYTYSAVWLLFGIVLLFFGTLRQDRMMRIASLGILLLTVGKVFLYDASELTGLWRVFSFFGLGLSLLGLSWFYSRFVFSQQKREN